MPNQPNDKSTPTARQVLDRAITGIENLRLLLEETETLTHCAGLSLDALPWASSGSARGYNRSSGAHGPNPGSNPGGAGATAPINQPPNPNAPNAPNASNAPNAPNAPSTDGDFDLDDFDSIAYFDPGDLTGASGFSQGEIGEYDPEDRGLALGRLQTLAIAAGKASKRSLRYCQLLQNYLQRAAARLDRGEFAKPRGAGEGAAGFSQPWFKSDDDPEATR